MNTADAGSFREPVDRVRDDGIVGPGLPVQLARLGRDRGSSCRAVSHMNARCGMFHSPREQPGPIPLFLLSLLVLLDAILHKPHGFFGAARPCDFELLSALFVVGHEKLF